MTDFSFEHTVDVRFSDHDMLGHVNNATYVTYLEEARVAYMREALGLTREEVSTVIANLEIDYRAPIQGASEATVALFVPEIGRTSFPMTYEIRADIDRSSSGRSGSSQSGSTQSESTQSDSDQSDSDQSNTTQVVATASTVQVWIDPESGSPDPLPEEIRAAIQAAEDHLTE